MLILVFPNKACQLYNRTERVPFTIDAHRSPHVRFFANRSFIGKQVGDVRDVGATLVIHAKMHLCRLSLKAGCSMAPD